MTTFDFGDAKNISDICIRRDNETNLIYNLVENFLTIMSIPRERAHYATPKDDAKIESFNSFLERDVIRRLKVERFEKAESGNRVCLWISVTTRGNIVTYYTKGDNIQGIDKIQTLSKIAKQVVPDLK